MIGSNRIDSLELGHERRIRLLPALSPPGRKRAVIRTGDPHTVRDVRRRIPQLLQDELLVGRLHHQHFEEPLDSVLKMGMRVVEAGKQNLALQVDGTRSGALQRQYVAAAADLL